MLTEHRDHQGRWGERTSARTSWRGGCQSNLTQPPTYSYQRQGRSYMYWCRWGDMCWERTKLWGDWGNIWGYLSAFEHLWGQGADWEHHGSFPFSSIKTRGTKKNKAWLDYRDLRGKKRLRQLGRSGNEKAKIYHSLSSNLWRVPLFQWCPELDEELQADYKCLHCPDTSRRKQGWGPPSWFALQ